MTRSSRLRSAVIASLALAGVIGATAAGAQQGGDAPVRDMSATEMVERLAPVVTTRGLRSLRVAPKPLDLIVNFDFDSARLQPDARPLLENLAQAISSERLAQQRFVIEGHTDSRGGARYNQQLSERRARAVLDFLIGHGAPAQRLRSVGKGPSEPLTPDNPENPVNRRVRVVADLSDPSPVALVTDAEALESRSAPPSLEPRAVPVADAPSIDVLAPALTGKIPSPTPIRVAFAPVAPSSIVPESFRVFYGTFKIDLTGRFTAAAKVTPAGISVDEASLPPGQHRLLLQVSDSLGRVGSRIVEFEVR